MACGSIACGRHGLFRGGKVSLKPSASACAQIAAFSAGSPFASWRKRALSPPTWSSATTNCGCCATAHLARLAVDEDAGCRCSDLPARHAVVGLGVEKGEADRVAGFVHVKRARQFKEHGDAGRAIVGPGRGAGLVFGQGVAVGSQAGIVVCSQNAHGEGCRGSGAKRLCGTAIDVAPLARLLARGELLDHHIPAQRR